MNIFELMFNIKLIRAIEIFFVYVILFLIIQSWIKKDRLTEIWIDVNHQIYYWLYIKTLTLRDSYLRSVSRRVAEIIRQLNNLMELEPLYCVVLEFKGNENIDFFSFFRKKKKKDDILYEATILYEVTKSKYLSIINNWQGIKMDGDMMQKLIIDTSRKDNEGIYVPDINKMPDGNLKDYLLSINVYAYFTVLIKNQKRSIHTLLIMFNRTEPEITGAELAEIKMAGKNVEKLMFKKRLSFSDLYD